MKNNIKQNRSNTAARKGHPRAGRVVSAEMSLWLCALAIAVASAIWTKERGALPGLAQIETPAQVSNTSLHSMPAPEIESAGVGKIIEPEIDTEIDTETNDLNEQTDELDQSIRWFDGKAARPARVIYMTVTGYSPDERSCGKFADNKTATMYSVWTNGMNLVAADPTVLPYWSMVSIPGYAGNDIVPVLDCGGAIKGNRIDLLYPTHEIARKWGVRQVPVTVWEFIEEDEAETLAAN